MHSIIVDEREQIADDNDCWQTLGLLLVSAVIWNIKYGELSVFIRPLHKGAPYSLRKNLRIGFQ